MFARGKEGTVEQARVSLIITSLQRQVSGRRGFLQRAGALEPADSDPLGGMGGGVGGIFDFVGRGGSDRRE